MAYDPQKEAAILQARRDSKKKAARDYLKKYSTGENQGVARKNIDEFRKNPEAVKTVKKQTEKMKGLKRGKENFASNAKIMAKAATPWGIMAIFSQGNILTDWPYALALIAAILKDIFDLAEFTGVGFALVFIFTLMCGIWIAMMMLLAGGGKGRRQQKIIRSWLILLSGTTMELLFGIDLLPIETVTVLIIYALALVDRKQSSEEK